MTFHGEERFRHAAAAHSHDHDHDHGHDDDHGHDHGHAGEPHESPWVVTVPLIALAIPSLLVGYFTVGPVLFGSFFGSSIFVLPANNIIGEMAREFHGPGLTALRGFLGAPFWLMVAGLITAWACFLWRPALADQAAQTFSGLRTILIEKYYFDWFNEKVIAPLARGIGFGLWKAGDQGLIDGALVNGSAATVGWFGGVVRKVQNGYLYSYAFWIVIGLAALLGWFLERR